MDDVATKRAKAIFKKENPDRNWELTSSRNEIGVDLRANHASEEERQAYLEKAKKRILQEAVEEEKNLNLS